MPDAHPPANGGTESLTARELEVLRLVCRGRTNLEIAAELTVSVNTVKSYIRTAYHKIGATRRVDAVRWGLLAGLVHDEPSGDDPWTW